MFSDFIKHYNIIRAILRDVFLYGCFSREGLEGKRNVSSRKISYEIRRIQQYVEEMCSNLGVLERETIKRTKYYSAAKDVFETLEDREVTELAAAVSLYKNILYPVTAGYYCEASLIDYLTYERGIKYTPKDCFQYKSLHFHPVIEEQVLWKILNTINERKLISLNYNLPLNKRRSHSSLKQLLRPYKIRYDIQCGRFYVVSYDNSDKCIICRLDRIEDVEVSESTYEKDNLKEFYERDLKYSWSSVPLGAGNKTEKVELEININEPKENYIIEQIKSEVQDGIIERLDKGRYRLIMQVNDSGEMVPWIRGYSGYIKIIRGRGLARRVAEDWKEMLETYGAF